MNMEWRVYNWQSQKVGQKGEVLKRNDYKCGFCKGKGIISHNKAIRCPACQGAGEVKIPGLAVICAYCNGNGRAHLNRDLTCGVCKGKGVVPIESNNIEICSVCKGRGREQGSSLTCLKCKGKGVVVKPKIIAEGSDIEESNTEDEALPKNNSDAENNPYIEVSDGEKS